MNTSPTSAYSSAAEHLIDPPNSEIDLFVRVPPCGLIGPETIGAEEVMRTKLITLPKPRKFDCFNYQSCLTEAAIKNSWKDMCAGCGKYRKVAISDSYLDTMSHSPKREYIHYETR